MAWTLEEAVSYYKKQGAPRDQSALISLLREIQEENGGAIPGYLLEEAAVLCDTKATFLQAIVKRIPSLRLKDQHMLEVCAGPNCGKHIHIAEYAEKLAKATGGKVVFRNSPCMRMCGKGPNVKLDGQIHHQMTEEKVRELMLSVISVK